MSDDNAETIPYRLALSVVRISGTITNDFSPQTSRPRTSASSDIEIFVEADPRPAWEQRLSLQSSFAKDRDFDLKLTPDGRLTSSSGTVTGGGGALLEAGIKVGAFIGSTMIGLAAKGFAVTARRTAKPADGKTLEETLADENPALHELRESYRSSIVALQKKMAAHGAAVAGASEVGLAKLVEGAAVRGTLERVRAEAAEVEAEVDAWRRSRFPSTSEERSFEIPSDDLPVLAAAEPSHEFDLAKLPAPLRNAAEQLGVIVAEVRQHHSPAAARAQDEWADDGIWFRATRPASLAIYERPLGSEADFKLRSVTPSPVIDSKSELSFLCFDSGLFEKRSGGVEFGDSGAVSHVTRASESAARQISAALSAAPGEIKESVEQANAVSEGIAKLRSSAAANRLADLKRQKETIDAEIAEKGALATRAQREKLDRLNADVALAEAEKKLAPAPTPPPAPNKAREEKLARAELDLELRRVETEMAQLATAGASADGRGVTVGTS